MTGAGTERAHDIEQILAAYLEAKLWNAGVMLDKAKSYHNVEVNAYTVGLLSWSEHQVATIRMLARDVPMWRNVIKNYYRKMKRRQLGPKRTRGKALDEIPPDFNL